MYLRRLVLVRGNCLLTQFSSFNQPDSIVQQQQWQRQRQQGRKSNIGLINERGFLPRMLAGMSTGC